MSTPAKLARLSRLRPGDGVSMLDYDDLQRWLRRAGPSYDVAVLGEKDRERIDAIHDQFYEVK